MLQRLVITIPLSNERRIQQSYSVNFGYPPSDRQAAVFVLQSSANGRQETKMTSVNTAKASVHPATGVKARSRTAVQEGKAVLR